MSDRAGYSIRIKRSAEKEMDRLPREVFSRIKAAILRLENHPRPMGAKKLQGADDHRLRVGAYRILYSIDDRLRIIEIIAVGHRREIYRRR